MSAAPSESSPWIHGPVSDLLLGCGGLYTLLFLVVPFLAGSPLTLGAAYFVPLIVLLVSVPHYGGTLLRVYETRDERRKYVFFTVYATLALFGWFVVGAYDLWIGSLMVTAYLSWSPWHYSGQNYGIALMFLRRRGIVVSPAAKRAFYASFVLSFLLALIIAHGVRGQAYDAPGFGHNAIEFVPLGLPPSLVSVLMPAVLVLYLASLAVAGGLLLRAARLRDLVAPGMMVVTQAFWFVVPFTVSRYAAATPQVPGSRYLLDSMVWVAVAHAAQYLWITSYYARRTGAWSGYGAYYTKVMLAGSLIWTIPAFLFAPWALGVHPFGAGLLLLVAAFVNLHHFVLDGAIWKLRDGAVASFLVRNAPDPARRVEPIGAERRSWLRGALWATAVLCVAVQVGVDLRSSLGFDWAVARDDLAGAERVLRQTRWLGGDTVERRLRLARAYQQESEPARAVEQLEEGLRIRPDGPLLWQALGEAQLQNGQAEAAIESLDRSVALAPRNAQSQVLAGAALSRLGRHAQAIDRLRTALAIDQTLAVGHMNLGNALFQTDELDGAIYHFQIAMHLQPDLPGVEQNLNLAVRKKRDKKFDAMFGGKRP